MRLPVQLFQIYHEDGEDEEEDIFLTLTFFSYFCMSSNTRRTSLPSRTKVECLFFRVSSHHCFSFSFSSFFSPYVTHLFRSSVPCVHHLSLDVCVLPPFSHSFVASCCRPPLLRRLLLRFPSSLLLFLFLLVRCFPSLLRFAAGPANACTAGGAISPQYRSLRRFWSPFPLCCPQRGTAVVPSLPSCFCFYKRPLSPAAEREDRRREKHPCAGKLSAQTSHSTAAAAPAATSAVQTTGGVAASRAAEGTPAASAGATTPPAASSAGRKRFRFERLVSLAVPSVEYVIALAFRPEILRRKGIPRWLLLLLLSPLLVGDRLAALLLSDSAASATCESWKGSHELLRKTFSVKTCLDSNDDAAAAWAETRCNSSDQRGRRQHAAPLVCSAVSAVEKRISRRKTKKDRGRTEGNKEGGTIENLRQCTAAPDTASSSWCRVKSTAVSAYRGAASDPCSRLRAACAGGYAAAASFRKTGAAEQSIVAGPGCGAVAASILAADTGRRATASASAQRRAAAVQSAAAAAFAVRRAAAAAAAEASVEIASAAGTGPAAAGETPIADATYAATATAVSDRGAPADGKAAAAAAAHCVGGERVPAVGSAGEDGGGRQWRRRREIDSCAVACFAIAAAGPVVRLSGAGGQAPTERRWPRPAYVLPQKLRFSQFLGYMLPAATHPQQDCSRMGWRGPPSTACAAASSVAAAASLAPAVAACVSAVEAVPPISPFSSPSDSRSVSIVFSRRGSRSSRAPASRKCRAAPSSVDLTPASAAPAAAAAPAVASFASEAAAGASECGIPFSTADSFFSASSAAAASMRTAFREDAVAGAEEGEIGRRASAVHVVAAGEPRSPRSVAGCVATADATAARPGATSGQASAAVAAHQAPPPLPAAVSGTAAASAAASAGPPSPAAVTPAAVAACADDVASAAVTSTAAAPASTSFAGLQAPAAAKSFVTLRTSAATAAAAGDYACFHKHEFKQQHRESRKPQQQQKEWLHQQQRQQQREELASFWKLFDAFCVELLQHVPADSGSAAAAEAVAGAPEAVSVSFKEGGRAAAPVRGGSKEDARVAAAAAGAEAEVAEEARRVTEGEARAAGAAGERKGGGTAAAKNNQAEPTAAEEARKKKQGSIEFSISAREKNVWGRGDSACRKKEKKEEADEVEVGREVVDVLLPRALLRLAAGERDICCCHNAKNCSSVATRNQDSYKRSATAALGGAQETPFLPSTIGRSDGCRLEERKMDGDEVASRSSSRGLSCEGEMKQPRTPSSHTASLSLSSSSSVSNRTSSTSSSRTSSGSSTSGSVCAFCRRRINDRGIVSKVSSRSRVNDQVVLPYRLTRCGEALASLERIFQQQLGLQEPPVGDLLFHVEEFFNEDNAAAPAAAAVAVAAADDDDDDDYSSKEGGEGRKGCEGNRESREEEKEDEAGDRNGRSTCHARREIEEESLERRDVCAAEEGEEKDERRREALLKGETNTGVAASADAFWDDNSRSLGRERTSRCSCSHNQVHLERIPNSSMGKQRDKEEGISACSTLSSRVAPTSAPKSSSDTDAGLMTSCCSRSSSRRRSSCSSLKIEKTAVACCVGERKKRTWKLPDPEACSLGCMHTTAASTAKKEDLKFILENCQYTADGGGRHLFPPLSRKLVSSVEKLLERPPQGLLGVAAVAPRPAAIACATKQQLHRQDMQQNLLLLQKKKHQRKQDGASASLSLLVEEVEAQAAATLHEHAGEESQRKQRQATTENGTAEEKEGRERDEAEEGEEEEDEAELKEEEEQCGTMEPQVLVVRPLLRERERVRASSPSRRIRAAAQCSGSNSRSSRTSSAEVRCGKGRSFSDDCKAGPAPVARTAASGAKAAMLSPKPAARREEFIEQRRERRSNDTSTAPTAEILAAAALPTREEFEELTAAASAARHLGAETSTTATSIPAFSSAEQAAGEGKEESRREWNANSKMHEEEDFVWKPFPTALWLCGSELKKTISAVEGSGFTKKIEKEIRKNSCLQLHVLFDALRYVAMRWLLVDCSLLRHFYCMRRIAQERKNIKNLEVESDEDKELRVACTAGEAAKQSETSSRTSAAAQGSEATGKTETQLPATATAGERDSASGREARVIGEQAQQKSTNRGKCSSTCSSSKEGAGLSSRSSGETNNQGDNSCNRNCSEGNSNDIKSSGIIDNEDSNSSNARLVPKREGIEEEAARGSATAEKSRRIEAAREPCCSCRICKSLHVLRERGIGGVGDLFSVRCLHMHYAFHLLYPSSVVGLLLERHLQQRREAAMRLEEKQPQQRQQKSQQRSSNSCRKEAETAD